MANSVENMEFLELLFFENHNMSIYDRLADAPRACRAIAEECRKPDVQFGPVKEAMDNKGKFSREEAIALIAYLLVDFDEHYSTSD